MKRSLATALLALMCSLHCVEAAAQPYAYVPGQILSAGVLSVIDTKTNTIVTGIPLRSASIGIAFSPDGSKVYVSDSLLDSIEVISTATNTVVATITGVGTQPERLAMSPDGTRLYAVITGPTPGVAVIDTGTNAVLPPLPVTGVVTGAGIVVSTDGSTLYVSNPSLNRVTAISTLSGQPTATIPVGRLPLAMAISPDGTLLYVVNTIGNSVSVVNTAVNGTVGTVAVPEDPRGVTFTPDGAMAYVASQSGVVSVIKTVTRSIVASVPVPQFPRDVAITPDGSRAYVATLPNVQILDTATNTNVSTVPFDPATAGSPQRIGIAPPGAVNCPTCPTLALSAATLNFGLTGDSPVPVTPAQTVTLTQIGTGTVPWTATASQPWITVQPASGTGAATLTVSVTNAGGLPPSGLLAGRVTVNAGGLANSPSLTVNLTIRPSSQWTAPVGAIDTPTPSLNNVTGSLPVTGWTVDDVGVQQVRILRDAVPGESVPGGEVFIGNAVFVAGARPDVAALFPTTPHRDQAGWGYMLLTNFLPNQGNGTFTLSIYADDFDGRTTLLGRRSITCTNQSATVPFGTLDTPAQGETVSGSSYVSFGWVLAAQPVASGRFIPFDGSTVRVYVDSVLQGTATYNNPRSDIQALFPGYANTDGAVGFRVLDTTALANGVHTIFWVASDDVGATAGIGSRYFTVANSSAPSGGGSARTGSSFAAAAAAGSISAREAETIEASSASVTVRHGFDEARVEVVWPDSLGLRRIRTAQLARITVDLSAGAPGARYRGYRVEGASLAPLPTGAHLNEASGEFEWNPGLAFGGTHRLVFIRALGNHEDRIDLEITVGPPQPPAR
jgi:YVTN family beta-propeller protein